MTHSATRLVALVCFSLFLNALCARSMHAQAIHEGKLTGTVTQEDGAVLPGATVDISSPQLLGGKRSTVTSGDGTYLFLNVPKGIYEVTTALGGFKTIVRDNVEVSADATTTVDVVLPVGAINETVTVNALTPLVDVKTSTTDSRIDHDAARKASDEQGRVL